MYVHVIVTVVLLLAAALAFPGPQPAAGAGFTVNSTADAIDANPGDGVCASAGGQCTLRAAIMEANALPGADDITLPAGTYTLTIPGADEYFDATGDLNIGEDLTITGAGPGATIIDAAGIDRVLTADGVVVIQGVTIANGATTGLGGGIYNNGTLTLEDISVIGNVANAGGGIYNFGTLHLRRAVVASNQTVDNPSGTNPEGGGIRSNYGDVTIEESTISGNKVTSESGGSRSGGGISVTGNALSITNSTISGNTARLGAGLDNVNGDVTLTNVTIVGNSAERGGGILNFVCDTCSASLNVVNIIIADNSPEDCDGTPAVSLGHNLDSDGSCQLSGPGDIANAGNVLGPLADNGGPTPTHALLPGSPALDSGDDAQCPAVDQRGLPRPRDGDGDGTPRCDIGAFEAQSFVPPPQGLQGDVNCDKAVDAVDALFVLRHVAGLPFTVPSCPDPGDVRPGLGFAYGDVNCDGAVDAVDALRILRYAAGLSNPVVPSCPGIGSTL